MTSSNLYQPLACCQKAAQEEAMSRAKDHPRSLTAEVHILFSGYVDLIGLNLAELTREAILAIAPTAINRRASTVSFVGDGEVRVIIDPGQDPHRAKWGSLAKRGDETMPNNFEVNGPAHITGSKPRINHTSHPV